MLKKMKKILNRKVIISVVLGFFVGYLMMISSGVKSYFNYIFDIIFLNEKFIVEAFLMLGGGEISFSILTWVRNFINAIPISFLFGGASALLLNNRISVRAFTYSVFIPLFLIYYYLRPEAMDNLGFGVMEMRFISHLRYDIFTAYVPLFVWFIIFYVTLNKAITQAKAKNQ